MLRCMVAFRDQDVPLAMVAPVSHQRIIKRDKCLTIANVKKGTNTLTVTAQSKVCMNYTLFYYSFPTAKLMFIY